MTYKIQLVREVREPKFLPAFFLGPLKYLSRGGESVQLAWPWLDFLVCAEH